MDHNFTENQAWDAHDRAQAELQKELKAAAATEEKRRASLDWDPTLVNATQAANLYSPGAIGREQSHPDFALEGAAMIARHLDAFYPGGAFVTCSRLLTRAEKLAALRAAIVAYEHLNW